MFFGGSGRPAQNKEERRQKNRKSRPPIEQIIAAPEGVVVPKFDLAEFIVGEGLGPQDGGEIGAGGVKGGMGAVQGTLRHVVQIDLGGFSAKSNGPGQTEYQNQQQYEDVPHWG